MRRTEGILDARYSDYDGLRRAILLFDKVHLLRVGGKDDLIRMIENSGRLADYKAVIADLDYLEENGELTYITQDGIRDLLREVDINR